MSPQNQMRGNHRNVGPTQQPPPATVVVSSTSSMRPPPPPPPPRARASNEGKGHHEEPTSSIPDLGESSCVISNNFYPSQGYFFHRREIHAVADPSKQQLPFASGLLCRRARESVPFGEKEKEKGGRVLRACPTELIRETNQNKLARFRAPVSRGRSRRGQRETSSELLRRNSGGNHTGVAIRFGRSHGERVVLCQPRACLHARLSVGQSGRERRWQPRKRENKRLDRSKDRAGKEVVRIDRGRLSFRREMTVQEFKPRGSAAEEHQPSGDILSPSSELLDNDKEQSSQVCYRGAPQDSENLLGRVLAEFDGTTVLCRVCGDKASGFHYGVHSCEGCKGFFRRSIQQKIQYRPCTKNQQCSILRINRNRCQYCRLKKCIAVGMSRDAVRFGRVPKREKARILAAMQQSSHSRSQEKAVAAELEDEQRLLATVVQAHLDTCDFTRDKVAPILVRARETPNYTACPPTLACPLNPNPQPLTGQQELLQDFSKRFSPAIRGVVEFAKRIPGFSLLAQDDQVTLLKAGVFEVLLVRLACMFDAQTNSMICLNGQVLKRESIHNSSNARFLMDSMFDFAERVNSLRLSDAELGLFCSVVVIAADRPGLRNTELVERMHNKLRNALQTVLAQNHPQHPDILRELLKKIPDLRTLNTLHSEKLLAFKMTEQQQQMQAQQQQQQTHVISAQQPQQQQQQQQQQQHWPMEEEPPASWGSASDVTLDEAVKSPLGSVSSTESTCSGEVASLTEYHHVAPPSGHHATTAPLLAATLAGGLCPHRRRANSGSTSSGDDELHRASLSKTPQPPQCPRFRKLDSPSDSGIESGTEKPDKPASSSASSAPTSVCSSPRSEDKEVEDMPVLKRVLQAPPLYDTNSLMDEAYKPHKKFRALRQKDSAEAEPAVIVQHTQSQLHLHLTSPPARSPSNQAQAQCPQTASLLSSTHSTLARSLMEGPRMTAEQLKRTDIIHNYIMRGEASPRSPAVSPSPAEQCASTTTITARSPQGSQGLLQCATSSYPSTRWPATSVITTTTGARQQQQQQQQQQSSSDYLMVGNSPASSPRYLSAAATSSTSTSPRPASSTAATLVLSGCPSNMMELQVDIADSQQPLNLSKKSPSPSPRPLVGPCKALSLEA